MDAAMKRRNYAVRYERDERGWWVAIVNGVAAQTQGRTLEQAQERIREALATLLDVDPATLDLVDDIRLPTAARRLLGDAKKASARAADQALRAEHATRDAARTLVKCGMSLRDAGTLLGVSRQRVHQILEPKALTRRERRETQNPLRARSG
jgi:predicted RNase H-like HicB family nuclease